MLLAMMCLVPTLGTGGAETVHVQATAQARGAAIAKRGEAASPPLRTRRLKPLAFVEYFNRTMAKPFKWAYKGKALTV
jgi:hypothetical protein